MKLSRLLYLALACFFAGSSLQAQDIHFSQFYASPLNLNPATTGVLSCDMRFSAIYRNQWASALGNKAFSTFSAGVETRFDVGKNDYWGLGVNLWADKAGTSSFSNVHGSVSASYIKRLGGRRSNNMYLVAGGAVGFSQRSIETLGLQFGEQWDGDTYNGANPSGENLANWNTRLTHADVRAGLFWWMALDKKDKSNVFAGIAFDHLTQANVAFIENGFDPLYMKTTVHLGGDFRIKRRLAVVPNMIMLFQGPSTEINLGATVRFDYSKRAYSNQAFEIGPMFRLVQSPTGTIASDAAIIAARMRYGSSTFGLSYDLNISALRPATNSNGAFEVSYVYTLCGVRNRKMGCPTF